MPAGLSPEQLLWLWLNRTDARMIQIEHAVVAGDILAGNPPPEWTSYSCDRAADPLEAKLDAMMARI